MNLYGSLAILLVMLFRLVFRRIPKKILVFFWIIVAVRLLCPFNFSSSLSLMNLIPEHETKQEQHIEQEVKTVPMTVRTAKYDKVVSDKADRSLSVEKPAFGLDTKEMLFIFWIGGSVLMLTYAGIRYVRVRRFVKGCRKSPDSLYLESDKTDTPFVAGVLRPRICIPSHIENNEREYLLLHEQTHIKNHDGIIKTFGFLVVCIHWFNPLVWLAYVMLCSDLEMRCDEEVIEKLGKDVKKDYCLSIIMHSVTEPSALPGNTAFSGFGLGALEVRMRINNLLKYKKISKLASALVLCAAIGLTAVLTACKQEETTAPSVSDTTAAETTEATTTSEMEATTSASETEGTTDDTNKFVTAIEFNDNEEARDDEELGPIIESLEDDGYSFTGVTGKVNDDEGSKQFIIIESDDGASKAYIGEDGTVTIEEGDGQIFFFEPDEDVFEAMTSESEVVVYSVQINGDGASVDLQDAQDLFDSVEDPFVIIAAPAG